MLFFSVAKCFPFHSVVFSLELIPLFTLILLFSSGFCVQSEIYLPQFHLLLVMFRFSANVFSLFV